MRKFIIHSCLFLLLSLGSMYALFLQADGYSDPFYIRFATPKQHSLILGTSKAAQGIQPRVLHSLLPESNIFNYAFTVAHSPYGPSYLKGIKRKFKAGDKPGIFILAVDAYSLASTSEAPDDMARFGEKNSFLNNLNAVSSKPNIPYLFTYYKNSYLKFFQRDTIAFLHDDGWLEINPEMDTTILAERIVKKKKIMMEKKNRFSFSKTRLSYLYQTIEFLKEHGEVYLVTLPVHPSLVEVDKAVVPDFDAVMAKLSKDTDLPYYNMMEDAALYTYTDGIHLYKDSGREVSQKIGQWIAQLQVKQLKSKPTN